MLTPIQLLVFSAAPVATLESAKRNHAAEDLEAAGSLGADDDPAPAAVERRMTRGSNPSVQRVTLEWTKIGCTYRTGATEKVVLQGKLLLVQLTSIKSKLDTVNSGVALESINDHLFYCLDKAGILLLCAISVDYGCVNCL